MKYIICTLPLLLVLVSCARKDATGPHATVLLRDGTQVTGTVTESSPRQIVLAADDGSRRTFDMAQVKSVHYDEHRPETGGSGAQPGSPAAERDPVHDSHPHPEESAIRTKSSSLPAGTQIRIRTEETIDSGKAVEGQVFAAEVARNVTDKDGDVVIPKGANAQLVILSASKGGKFKGTSDLVLDLKAVSIDGRMYELDTTNVSRKGKDGVGANKRTAKFGGTGAAIGAVIGAIAGGGKGAAIGAGAGAGAGVLTQVITKGGSIRVPAESVLTFRLEEPLRVVAAQ